MKATIFNPWIKNSDFLYDSAVNAIIAEEKAHSPDKQVSGFNTFAAFHKFGIQKGEKKKKKIVYIWINYQSFYVENDQIWKSSGGSYPYKCYFVNNEFVKYEIPDTSNNYQNEMSLYTVISYLIPLCLLIYLYFSKKKEYMFLSFASIICAISLFPENLYLVIT